jgi:hypothetical protein
MCHKAIVRDNPIEGAVQMQVTTIGIDLAKNVFHLHGVDANDKAVFNKRRVDYKCYPSLPSGIRQARQERCYRCRGGL